MAGDPAKTKAITHVGNDLHTFLWILTSYIAVLYAKDAKVTPKKKGRKVSKTAKPAHPIDKEFNTNCTVQQEEDKSPPRVAAKISTRRALEMRPFFKRRRKRVKAPASAAIRVVVVVLLLVVRREEV
jgi:hypothetical protein